MMFMDQEPTVIGTADGSYDRTPDMSKAEAQRLADEAKLAQGQAQERAQVKAQGEGGGRGQEQGQGRGQILPLRPRPPGVSVSVSATRRPTRIKEIKGRVEGVVRTSNSEPRSERRRKVDLENLGVSR